MKPQLPHRFVSLFAAVGLLGGLLVAPATAQQATPSAATPVAAATPLATSSTDPSDPVDLDVLFVGAHPDDEAFGLAAYGQWAEYNDITTGVITITRGEGGGNAVGTDEGPDLGILREDEERRAVAVAGIDHVYNLDKVDFYYTVSAPLTSETWDYEDTLDRVVRVVRTTQPEVIITMNPAPTPGNHGHHQLAARLAIDAFAAAADPDRFPEHITQEGLAPWSAASVFQNGAAVESMPGPDCATSFSPRDPSQTIYGVWQGTVSELNDGRTWGEVARDGQRTYVSQGWAVFPDAPTDPAEIGCNYFTLIESRVPASPDPASTTAMLENAVIASEGGLPLGTEVIVSSDQFLVLPDQPFSMTATVALPDDGDASAVTVDLPTIDGWEATIDGQSEADGVLTTTFSVVPPATAEPGSRQRVAVDVAFGDGAGTASTVVEVAPFVTGVLAPLPEIAQFQDWAAASGVPQLNSLILPVMALGSGESAPLTVVLTNNTGDTQSGSASVMVPEGFSIAPESVSFIGLGPGGSTTADFTVTNTDATLPTSNEGGEGGNYPLTIVTNVGEVESTQAAALNLVPVTVVPAAPADAAVDGVIAEGEYSGDPLDLSRIWEGQEVDGPADASGTAWVTWANDGLYIAVEVVDDSLGATVTPEDAKRHWRTDSVEIAIDPLGTAPNTSATFKVGIFPSSTDGSPQAYRDADAHQGPVAETAPGFEVASTLTEPYTGYVLETFIPFDALPTGIDPDNAALNIFIYDSDTDDLTGQTRLGWSTWNGVQGDPYRWGHITLDGFDSSTATPVAQAAGLADPIMPLDAAQSVMSPLSIAQSATDGVPLAGLPAVGVGEGLVFRVAPTLVDDMLVLGFESSSNGTAHYFVVTGDGTVVAGGEVDVIRGITELQVGGARVSGPATLLLSYLTNDGQVEAWSFPLGG